MLLLYPTLKPTSQWFGPVVTHFRTDRKEVWLTIDDGPGEETAAFVALLEAHGAVATFFVKGANAARRPDLLKEAARRGHTIANHSHTHPSGTFWCLPPHAIASQIDRCNDAIRQILGSEPRLFRAPVGLKNFFVHPLLERRGMQLIGWDARGYDAIETNAVRSAARILRSVAPGSILLLHEGGKGPRGERSVRYQCLKTVLEALSAQGYRCVIPPAGALTCGARNVRR